VACNTLALKAPANKSAVRARPPSHPAHPGLPATCSAAPVSPGMRVARVKNGPEPAEHGLQLGGCLSCRDAPPAGLRPDFYLLPPLPRGKPETKNKNKTKQYKARGSLEQETFLWAGRARNTDGTHPRASSGARSVVSGPFPEASVAGMAASLICLRPARPYGAELVSTWEASGAAACRPSQPSPRRPSFRRPAVSPWHPLNPFSSVPMVSESSAVWAGWSRSPRQTLRHGAVVVALAPLASLIFGPVLKEEPAASSTS